MDFPDCVHSVCIGTRCSLLGNAPCKNPEIIICEIIIRLVVALKVINDVCWLFHFPLSSILSTFYNLYINVYSSIVAVRWHSLSMHKIYNIVTLIFVLMVCFTMLFVVCMPQTSTHTHMHANISFHFIHYHHRLRTVSNKMIVVKRFESFTIYVANFFLVQFISILLLFALKWMVPVGAWQLLYKTTKWKWERVTMWKKCFSHCPNNHIQNIHLTDNHVRTI